MQKSVFQTKTDLTELGRVLNWFDEFVQSSLPNPVLMQCQTLLAEGFTNAVRHAHKGQSVDIPIDFEITLTRQPTGQKIEIRIWDYGQPFDLTQKLNSLPDEIDVESLGGRGLKLIQQMADNFTYVRTEDQRNCLLITKIF
jgi:serine/threonine-protein kinase RsbW